MSTGHTLGGRVAAAIAAAVCCLLQPFVRAQSSAVTSEGGEWTFERDFAVLSSTQHRLVGREDGSLAAGRHVERRLKGIGVDDIHIQTVPAVTPCYTECRLECDGRTHVIYAVRPNLLQASVTPEGGIAGQTLYSPKNGPWDYPATFASNRIVVLDADSKREWTQAFAMGARAVLFIEDPSGAMSRDIHAGVPANLPRFMVPAATAEALGLRNGPRDVVLKSACTWEAVTGRNVIGIVRGSNPVFDSSPGSPRESIVLAVGLDSYSEVPEISPGARDAANIAALLQIAGMLVKDRPRRDVILAFFDGQTQSHLGAREFYGALFRRIGERQIARTTLEERGRMLGEEKADVLRVLSVLERPDMFSAEIATGQAYLAAVRKLRSEVRRINSVEIAALAPLRLRLQRLLAAEQTDEVRAAIAGIKSDGPQLGEIDRLEVEDLAWNSILRSMDKAEQADDPEVAARLAERWIRDPDAGKQEAKRGLFVVAIARNMKTARTSAITSLKARMDEIALSEARLGEAVQLYNAAGGSDRRIVLHVSLNLGDGGPAWSVIHGDSSSLWVSEDVEGIYSSIFKSVRETAGSPGSRFRLFDERPVSMVYSSRLFAPCEFADSSAVARFFAIYNVALMTTMDAMPRQGLPGDTAARLNLAAFSAQVPEVGAFVKDFAGHPVLSMGYPNRPRVGFNEVEWSGGKSSGRVVKRTDVGDPMRTPSVPHAIVAAIPVTGADNWKGIGIGAEPPGFSRPLILRGRSDGMIDLPVVCAAEGYPMIAVEFEGSAGESRGIIGAITVENSFPKGTAGWAYRYAIDIAGVHPVTVVAFGHHRLVPSTVMEALTTSLLRTDRSLVCESDNILTIFAPMESAAAKIFNPYGAVVLENLNSKKQYQGVGMSVLDGMRHPVTALSTARDLHTLNAYRLNLLRNNSIGDDSLDVLHGKADDLMRDAESLKSASAQQRHGMFAASAALSRRVYIPLVATMNDLVTAVVFLLLLAIPFAFSVERLLIGTPHIYRRIGWFAVFFAATFGILYAVNPAFKLAAVPVIIFLAFAIILLSSLVIFIMMRKLETEMKRMHGASGSAHAADISRISTMTAAVNMGISTMRRRPIRTLLTSATVILLTFTILTFASFSSVWGVRKTYVGTQTVPPDRIVVRDALWGEVDSEVAETLGGFLTGRGSVVPRVWVAPLVSELAQLKLMGNVGILLADSTGKNLVPMSAVVGLDTRDVDMEPGLRSCFSAGARMDLLNSDGIFLTGAVAKALGLSDDDVGKVRVLLKGQSLLYAGRIEDRMAQHTMIDGSSILPVDFGTSMGGGEVQPGQTLNPADADVGTDSVSFVPYAMDSVAVVSRETSLLMGGRVRSLTIYPDAASSADKVAEDVATVSAMPTYVAAGGSVRRLFFSKIVEASGIRDLIIPVVLGGLIVFATMLGSVADREREIYTFSSLGLAPGHVGMLFFAESSVYAVVGGMGGYLLGQLASKLLSMASAAGWFMAPAMNFSSMNAIVTIFIVMGVVLLSTLYPAAKASKSANPGVQRTWRMPDPVGDVFDIRFPFTVSEYDLTGVASYLEEHFLTFSDTSIGVFATTSCRVLRQKENDMLGFAADVALAPFDLGVEQSVVILSEPSDVEGIDEIRVLVRRRSGAYSDWRRANRVFVMELRRQFLLWRTISADVAADYRRRTLDRWNEIGAESRSGLIAMFGGETGASG
jgi:hypothetical protein